MSYLPIRASKHRLSHWHKNSNFGRYEDYRSKGKYSADLLWERNHRLKSEEENRKTWEQIKKDAASRMPEDSSNKWSLAALCQNLDRDR